ncbi:MAG: VOC family protein [Geminicoccaceae bacterium]
MATHGSFYWNELMTTEPEKAAQFYAALTGATVDPMPMAFGTYHVLKKDGVPLGGIMAMPPDAPPMPNHWFSYMAVDDADEAVTRVRELGGAIYKEPFEVPDVGRIAVIADSTGAALGIITPVPR